jgi:predicted component of type VI protein secretion system
MAEMIVMLKGRELGRVPMRGNVARIGRDEGCDVHIDNPGVSRHHATITCENGKHFVNDEHSANGLFLNGAQVEHSPLNDGDVLHIGKFEVIFSLAGGPEVSGPSAPAPQRVGHRNPVETMAMPLEDVRKQVAERTAAARERERAEELRVRGFAGAPPAGSRPAVRRAATGPVDSAGGEQIEAQPATAAPAPKGRGLAVAVALLAALVVLLSGAVGVLLWLRTE